MSETMEREFGWDDAIENDGADFEIFPEGDYDFEVTGYNKDLYINKIKLPTTRIWI